MRWCPKIDKYQVCCYRSNKCRKLRENRENRKQEKRKKTEQANVERGNQDLKEGVNQDKS